LPPLAESEALEVAAIAAVSACGPAPQRYRQRPFRAPHHSSSTAALVGGGARARPGEVSLAHHGVLFLDELPEFARAALEALREPLESGSVSVSRAALQARYPAAFQLVAAMNPCPCGMLGDTAAECRCTPAEVRAYRGRISGPLLDRLDMHVEVPRLAASEFAVGANEGGETTADAAVRVAGARRVQLARQKTCNAWLADAAVQRWCRTDAAGQRVLARAMERFGLSGRGRQRVLKVARTVADLAGERAVTAAHISEALTLRCLDHRGATAPAAPCDRPPV
jgi:magnesium chelatase family protein